ncbi:Mbov_0399 family ICE element protein [Spiroplasma floricola]|nr:hypothetical protein [Spiroplasma floricola]
MNLSYVPIKQFNNSIQQKELKNNLEDISNYSYDPSYPSFNLYSDFYSRTQRLYIDSGKDDSLPNCSNCSDQRRNRVNNGEWYYFEWQAKEINVLNYAPNKQVFLDNYKEIKISFYYNYNTWDGGTGWSDNDEKNISPRLNKDIDYNFSSNSGWIYAHSYHNEINKAHLQIEFGHSWRGNNLILKWKLGASVYWKGGSWYNHSSFVMLSKDSFQFKSNFNQNNLKSKIQSALSKNFTIKSDTSPDVSNNEKNGLPGKPSKSNKELVISEIDKRLRTSFGIDYSAWFSKPILKRNDTFNDEKSYVSITFKDEQQISGSKQFLTNVIMPVNITLTDLYYQRSAQKRLVINPGKIVNPNSQLNELIIDKPEYDAKNNTFVYHNSIDVTFTAISESEILTVNGQEVPVFNNIYRIKLDNNLNTYKIEVNGIKNLKGITKLNLNINIQSLANKLNYRWVGWNPKENLEQSKLIEKTLGDGKPNPDYDPSINSKTGMRNEYIYIERNMKFPFYQDPLDKFGNIITDYKNINKSIIAEAAVANSGVTLLEKFDKAKIYRVDRLKLDENFKLISKQENVNIKENEQWSIEGLWHYVIYLQDYVKETIDPSNPGSQNINATKGSTIHKLLYISNKSKDYTRFTSLDFVSKNQSIFKFWDSLAGIHLKNYLISYTTINTSQKIEDLTYEQIIMYWKKYVSDQISQKIDVPQNPVSYKDLKNLNISSLKMNEINPLEVKNKIINHVKKYVEKFIKNSVYKTDYIICDENENQIEELDFQDFINLSENNKYKKITLFIKALGTSSLLIGRQNFNIINNKEFEESKNFDLSTIKDLKSIRYNFTNADNQIKRNFLNNYIYEYVKKILQIYKPKKIDWEYEYDKDYYISLNSSQGKDIKVDTDLEKILYKFLNSKTQVVLEVFIISRDESIKLSGLTNYKIINDPKNSNVAPEVPEPPFKPEVSKKNNISNRTVRWWIILIICFSILLLILFGVILWKRRKVKKVK